MDRQNFEERQQLQDEWLSFLHRHFASHCTKLVCTRIALLARVQWIQDGRQLRTAHLRPQPSIHFTTSSTKGKPLGEPTPVTLSQPLPVFSDVSVPKESTYQRELSALW